MRPQIRRSLLALLAAAIAAVSGCNVEKLAPDDVRQASGKAIVDLRAGHMADVKAVLIDELKAQDVDGEFLKMRAAFPDTEATSASVVAVSVNLVKDQTTYTLRYRYMFAKVSVFVDLVWLRTNGQLRLAAFQVHQFDDALNAFTFSGKGPANYIVLLLGLAALALTLYSLVACIRTRGLKRKWLWIIFILASFVTLRVNWTTGEYKILLFNIQFLGFSALQLAGAPWIVSAAVPVGAVIFLDRRRKAALAPPVVPPTI